MPPASRRVQAELPTALDARRATAERHPRDHKDEQADRGRARGPTSAPLHDELS
jgi:hypothetical protein